MKKEVLNINIESRVTLPRNLKIDATHVVIAVGELIDNAIVLVFDKFYQIKDIEFYRGAIVRAR